MHRQAILKQHLEDVVRGKCLLNESLVRVSKQQLAYAKTYASECRSANALGRRGFSKDKETMAVNATPRDLYWDFCAYTDSIKDPVERDKAREKLQKHIPIFNTR